MLLNEFISLTGYNPTTSEFDEINEAYMNCDANKYDFCEQWAKAHRKSIRTQKAIAKKAADNAKRANLIRDIFDWFYSYESGRYYYRFSSLDILCHVDGKTFSKLQRLCKRLHAKELDFANRFVTFYDLTNYLGNEYHNLTNDYLNY